MDGGAIVALTSDHVAHNLPYGSSKGALDRIVRAAAVELGGQGIRANAVNPGPVDTGWMSDEVREMLVTRQPIGPPRDARGRREAGLVPALGRWRLDDRPADPHRRRVLELAGEPVSRQLAGAYCSVTCAAGSGSLDVRRSWWATAIMMHMSPSVVILSVPARP